MRSKLVPTKDTSESYFSLNIICNKIKKGNKKEKNSIKIKSFYKNSNDKIIFSKSNINFIHRKKRRETHLFHMQTKLSSAC